jgi:predicted RNA-binding Zn-ribbon protein involved in translation (DUF1610 family)
MGNSVETEIVVQRNGRETTLLFTCPKCGDHVLIETNTAVEVELTVEYFAIGADENGEPIVENFDYSSNPTLVGPQDFSEVLYRCAGCDSELTWTNEDGESRPVKDNRKLAEWLLKNCAPQAQ